MTRPPAPRGAARAGRDERAPLCRLLAAGLALTATATAGCGGGGGTRAVSPGRPAAAPHSPGSGMRPAGAPVPPAAVEPALGAAAVRYLQARENAIAYTHPTPRDWLRQVRPVMTPTGWARLAVALGDRGGFPAAQARTHHWSVQANVTCRTDPDASPATPTVATVVCAVTDRTIDPGGRPVPARNLPGLWPYTGPQQPALLALRRLGGRWLVDDDQTGRAG